MVIDPSTVLARAPFSSGHGFAKVLIILILFAGTIDAIGAYSDLLQVDLISWILMEQEQLSVEPVTSEGPSVFDNVAYEKQAIEDTGGISVEDGAITDEEITLNDDRQAFIGMLQLIWLPIFALFLIWLYKAYRNLPALGATELSSSARMAVAYFFIPFISLYRPYTAVAEIWKGSEPGFDSTTKAIRKTMKSPSLLKIWWLLWVAAGIVSSYSFQFNSTITDDTAPDAYVYLSWILFIADTLSAVAAILTVLVIRQIDRMQQEKSKWTMTSDVIAS